jgi:membrane protease YdiL (CAAX protease family)
VPALVFALVFPTLATWLYFIQFAGSPAVRIFYIAGKVVQFCFPLVFVALVERGKAQFGGACSSAARLSPLRSLGIGLALGIAVGALILALYHGVFSKTAAFADVPQEVRAKLQDAGIVTPGGFIMLAAFYSVIHSILEEYYWRWFVFGHLRYALPLAPAVVVSSLGFMAHHTLVIGRFFGGPSLMTVLLSAGVAVGGALWAWLYQRSGHLYGPWLSHMLVDASLMAIGYQMLW